MIYKLLFLAIFTTKIAQGQDCDADRAGWSLSTNFTGISAEIAHIAQKTRIGFVMGITVFPVKAYDEVKNEYYHIIGGDMRMYGTYKIIHVPDKYSIHLLGGGVFDIDNGIYLSTGTEIRKPITLFSKKGAYHDKMLFFRGLYPLDFRIGMIFPF